MTLWRRYFILALLLILAAFANSCTSVVRYSNKTSTNTTAKKQRVRKKVDPAKNEIQDKKTGLERFEDKLLSSYNKALIHAAEKWIGTPYQYGGNSENGIDCSAFVQNVYNEIGVKLPRTAAQQYDFTRKVNIGSRQVGDLVFFRNKGKVSHVGIYIGKNQMIHSSSSKGVIITELSEKWYTDKYYATGRVY